MHETHPVRQAFQRAVETAPLKDRLCGASALFVGFSGGADSAALLTLASAYCAAHGISCTAIHVHHGIRGAEADRDAEACQLFCRSRGIPLLLRRVNAPERAKELHIGLEDAARQLRYEAFETALAAHPGALCATAHSADDNLETVLHHILRGSALDGLCGIPAVRGAYIRPLLTVSAADIRDFCAAEHIPFVEDSTNANTAYTRNYIRAEIVPRLRQITPSPEAAVTRMCAHLCADAEFLHETTLRSLGEFAHAPCAPRALLNDMPDALLSRAICILYENTHGDAHALTSTHINAVIQLIRTGMPGRISLPGRLCARLFADQIEILPEEKCVPVASPTVHVPLKDGTHFFPEYGFCLQIGQENAPECTDGKNIYKLSICSFIPSATISGEIFLRFRQPGDSVRQGGMSRSVKKLMCDKKIPPQARATLPVIADDAGILWIPGVCRRDSVAETNDSGKILFSYYTL